MTAIHLQKVTFGYTEPLFKDATFAIGDGDRIGIVGHNGEGKSTLLQCIAGRVEPDAGTVIGANSLKAGFMEQDIPPELMDMKLRDVLIAALPPDASYNEWQADIALQDFKFPAADHDRPVRELSGGWQRLALIARAVLRQPGILLLDEPTNHLDVEKIMALENWLNGQVTDMPLVVVSHDRRFLDRCTRRTLFLRHGQVRVYNRPYTAAREMLDKDEEIARAQHAKTSGKIDRLASSAHDLRQTGMNDHSDAALRKARHQADRAAALQEALAPLPVEKRRDIRISGTSIEAKRIVALKDVRIFSPRGDLLFRIDQLDLMNGDRLAILGVNGSGKSQLLKFLHESFGDKDAAQRQGVTINPGARQGYMDQHLAHLPLQSPLHDYVARAFSLDDQGATRALVAAGFAVPVQKMKIGLLSHGQRARLALLGLYLASPNIYVLDEPTNHLDIAGREQLEKEIADRQAAAIFVTHDRAFAQAVGTKFYVIQDGGLVRVDSPDIYYAAILEAPEAGKARLNLTRKKGQVLTHGKD
jgi:ATPase subunit of ABC transporter with duplicated ATPase domains